MINITVHGTAIYGFTEARITSGTVGRIVKFTFDEFWNGLQKIGVFSCNGVTKEVELNDANECEFPWEVLVHENVGHAITVGICGLYDNKIIYPTKYTGIGNLLQGTRVTGETGKEYTPSAAEQALAAAKSVREDADNGVFDGKSAYQTAVENGYEGTEEEFGQALADAVTGGGTGGIVREKDPTVPAWAKEENPPTYTAEDVGALPADTVIPSSEDIKAEVETALEEAKASGDFNGPKGDNYVLTDADKTEIAEITAEIIDTSLLNAIGSGVLE